MHKSPQTQLRNDMPSAPPLDVMADVITEIRSGRQETDASTGASDKEYIVALNSLMNSPKASVCNGEEHHNEELPSGLFDKEETSFTNSGDKTHNVGWIANDAADEDNNKRGGPAAASTETNDSPKETEPFHIGGPNTCLPFFAESFLSWSLCLSCLSVSGYHYFKSILLSSNVYCKLHRGIHGWVSAKIKRWLIGGQSKQLTGFDANFTDDGEWIPLTTCTRDELSRHSPWESYLLLVRVLEKDYPETLVPLLAIESDAAKLDGIKTATSRSDSDQVMSNKEFYAAATQQADTALIRVLRHDGVCRRLASLAMRPHEVVIETTKTTTTKTVSTITPSAAGSCAETHTMPFPTKTAINTSQMKTTSTLLKQLPHNHLLQRLSKAWNKLLALPSLEEAKTFYRIPTTGPPTAQKNYRVNDAHHAYKISLILPAYGEKGAYLQVKLNKALQMACCPEDVEVIVVDAGGCSNLEIIFEEADSEKHWGRICIVSFSAGGGRGPCLNYGANSATGRILTFCHSDTALPIRWDQRIIKTLEHDGKDDNDLRRLGTARVNSCSFMFGIDQSREGLSMPFSSSLKQYFPPGLRAVETTANLRSCLYSLPYGDSTLSLHAAIFHFLGGYPDQCLMEDYELVSLLRLRSALIDQSSCCTSEKLTMIRGQPALCSPRRWQKFGVLYVTYMNSKLVNLYAGAIKLGANDLFKMYYGTEPPKREASLNTWEVELENRLNDTTTV